MAQTFQLACVVVLTGYVIMSLEKGTTPHIEKIFKGRCLNYRITRSHLLASSASYVNCDDLWRNFSSVWRNKSSCGDHNFTYDEMFKHLDQKLPLDKLLFWSGTKMLAHKLSDNGRRYVTLEDTLIGFVADSLTWCGHTSGDGINNENCPEYNSCAAEPVKNFWDAASKWFASQAIGEVSVLLNGSNPNGTVYSNVSIFGSLEVPSLQSNAVRKLTAIVVHDLGKAKTENCCPSKSICDLERDAKGNKTEFDCDDNSKENCCPSKSICYLERDVTKKKIKFDCDDNWKVAKLLLCLDSPHHHECALQSAAVILGNFMYGSSMWARLTSATAMATLLMISFMLV